MSKGVKKIELPFLIYKFLVFQFFALFLFTLPTSFTMTPIFRIDNLIVQKLPRNVLKIEPIVLFQKQQQVTLDLAKIPYVSTGSRVSDNSLVSRLVSGTARLRELNIIFH